MWNQEYTRNSCLCWKGSKCSRIEGFSLIITSFCRRFSHNQSCFQQFTPHYPVLTYLRCKKLHLLLRECCLSLSETMRRMSRVWFHNRDQNLAFFNTSVNRDSHTFPLMKSISESSSSCCWHVLQVPRLAVYQGGWMWNVPLCVCTSSAHQSGAAGAFVWVNYENGIKQRSRGALHG